MIRIGPLTPPVPNRKPSSGVPFPAKYILRLYVAGATPRSHQAVLDVRQMCSAGSPELCDLEVIDVFQQPQRARRHQIIATPTLVVEFPGPMRHFIGNLVNTADLVFKTVLPAPGRLGS